MASAESKENGAPVEIYQDKRPIAPPILKEKKASKEATQASKKSHKKIVSAAPSSKGAYDDGDDEWTCSDTPPVKKSHKRKGPPAHFHEEDDGSESSEFIFSLYLDDGYQVESFVHFNDAIEYIAPKGGVTVRDVKELLVNVSSLDAREGKRDGSVMIYKVAHTTYWQDRRPALCVNPGS